MRVFRRTSTLRQRLQSKHDCTGLLEFVDRRFGCVSDEGVQLQSFTLSSRTLGGCPVSPDENFLLGKWDKRVGSASEDDRRSTSLGNEISWWCSLRPKSSLSTQALMSQGWIGGTPGSTPRLPPGSVLRRRVFHRQAAIANAGQLCDTAAAIELNCVIESREGANATPGYECPVCRAVGSDGVRPGATHARGMLRVRRGETPSPPPTGERLSGGVTFRTQKGLRCHLEVKHGVVVDNTVASNRRVELQ